MKSKLKIGIISEKKLIEYCATDKQREKYNNNGHFVSDLKNAVLKNASLQYEIKDLGNREYEIIKIYDYKLPSCINKLHNGLYQYIVPLMLSKIINERDQYNKVNFTFYKWARLIDMINNNYYPIKKNKVQYSKELNIDENTLEEYFTRVDDSIQYYIFNALEYLRKSGVIQWYKVPMICIRHINVDDKVPNDKHNIDVQLSYETRRATEEETKYSLECIDKIKEELHLENLSQCFFGKHAQKFANRLKILLRKKDIEYFYDTYEAYCVGQNIKKCKNILDTYNISEPDKFIIDFNKEFKNNIISLAEKRYTKLSDSFDDNYIDYFKQLCDITIDSNSKRIKYITAEDKTDIKEILSENINLSINGNKVKL